MPTTIKRRQLRKRPRGFIHDFGKGFVLGMKFVITPVAYATVGWIFLKGMGAVLKNIT
jgi:hypothetical protein